MSSNALSLVAVLVVVTMFSSQWRGADAGIDFTVCARMDDNPLGVPIGKEIAEKACIVACSIQNCGTGKCEKPDGKKTCICDRCANGGGSIPVGK